MVLGHKTWESMSLPGTYFLKNRVSKLKAVFKFTSTGLLFIGYQTIFEFLIYMCMKQDVPADISILTKII
jgi:hypothetical protein